MDRYLTIIFLTSIKDTVYETARTRFLNLGQTWKELSLSTDLGVGVTSKF